MSSTEKPTKGKALANVQALIAGTQKHVPTGLTIGNATFTQTSLTTLLQSLVDAMQKQSAAQKAARDALTELRDVQSHVGPIIKGLRVVLVGMFGNASQTLADFGLAPHKARAPLTVEKKAAATARAKATRIARATKGPKAKLAIKGTAPAQSQVAPAAAPAKPAG
jgi:hypothetical protein